MNKQFMTRRSPNAVGWLLLIATLLTVPCTEIFAAGVTVLNQDRNLRIWMQDAQPTEKDTRLLYYTAPDITQKHASEKCAVNLYLLDLEPGLVQAEPQLLAGNYCGFFRMSGTLLADGDVLIVAGDRVETWRPARGMVRSFKLSDATSLQGRWRTINDGSLPVDVSRNGHLVLAKALPRQRNDTTTASAVIASLADDGATNWTLDLQAPGELLDVQQVWATADGGAMLYVAARPLTGAALPGVEAPAGAVVTDQYRLYRVSASGKEFAPIIVASSQQPDYAHPLPLPDMRKDPAGYQAAFQRQQQLTNLESIDKIAARPQDDGSVDVLIRRLSNDDARQGTFLYRVGGNGELIRVVPITQAMRVDGLDHWSDFLTRRDQIILYGVLSTRENRLPQGYVSWIDLASNEIVTRLVPLSTMGLEAARNARDEDFQNLNNNPSQDPQLLSSLAGKPLTVSLVQRSRRPAIQIDEGISEGEGQLELYTEAREAHQAAAANEAQYKQRKLERKARNQQFDTDMAAAIGVSPEKYAAMSNRERKEAMLKSGNMGAMMAAAQKQMEMMQQSGAMKQDTPQMSPEDMNARMAAAMAQAQQAMASFNNNMPNITGASASNDMVVKLDANLRGTLDYDDPRGRTVTLLIRDQQTGKELLTKHFADGKLHEFIDFSRFNIPLSRIDVVYRDVDNTVVGNPELVVEK